MSDSIKFKIESGSANLPSPIRPLANSPTSAGINIFPLAVSLDIDSLVDGCLYISKSIAGAK